MRIEPYYSDGRIEIYHGDCLEVMPELSVNVDMVLADPPYGTTACAWDSVIPLAPMWKQLKRLIKSNGAIVITASQPFTTTLISSNMEMFKYCWVWEKSKAGNFPHAPNMPLKIHEDVVVFSKGIIAHLFQVGNKRMAYNPQGTRDGTTRVWQHPNTSKLKYHRESQTQHTTGYTCKREGYPTTHLKIGSHGRSIHPTQKPVALMEYLIKTYTNEGDVVLDFTMGSGTTLVAAKNLNRKAIGIETQEKYCEIAVKRLAQDVLNFSEPQELSEVRQ